MNVDRTILSYKETLKKMERFFSPTYGLANSVKEFSTKDINVSVDGRSIFVGNLIPMYNTLVEKTTSSWEGAAVALNREKSKVKAFGEFIERYCGSCDINIHEKSMVFDSYDNLKHKGDLCLDLRELIYFEDSLYDDTEFYLSRYFSDSPISWIKGTEITSRNEVLVPAQKVFISYPYPVEELNYLRGISTGLACGGTYSQAALSAILEVIERDSFMLTWLVQIPGIRVEIDNILNADLKKLYKHIQKHLVGEDKLFVFDISKTEGVYTILTFIRNDLCDAFGLIVSAASHFSPEIALLKSLEELCQVQAFAYFSLVKDKSKKCQGMEKHDINNLREHMLYYSTGRHSSNIDFINSSKQKVNLSDMKDYSNEDTQKNLDYLIDLFKQKEQSVFIVDITRPEICEEGFTVLKAIIPEYIDLDIEYRFKQLKNIRLQRYQKKYAMEINNNPHPFA